MKRLIVPIMIIPLSFWIASAVASGGTRGSHLVTDEKSFSDDCADHMQFHDGDFASSVHGEEARSLPSQPLNIVAERNGGIHVTTWDRPEFSVKLCKQVFSNNESRARSLLSQIRLDVQGGEIRVVSPRDGEDDYSLSTQLLVEAPRSATLELRVNNGGVSLYRFSGTASANAVNGGISISGSSGKLKAVAQNGGINIKDSSGEIRADVQNGGINIALAEHLEGSDIEAHTLNGGVVVALPANFDAGLEIAGSSHAGIICKAEACAGAQRTWDVDGRKILRLGSSEPHVRASTVNGGIVIEPRRQSRSEL